MNVTRLNPDGTTYRAPLVNGTTCRFDSGPMIPCITGTIVDRLGKFEALGMEPEEIEKIIKTYKK